jgi:transcriptional regulator GlxA family with amidase domain
MTRRICVLVFPDFQLLDAAGPIAAFESAGAYKFALCRPACWVRSSSGVAWVAQGLPRGLLGDTLLVSGGSAWCTALEPLELGLQARQRAWLRRRYW